MVNTVDLTVPVPADRVAEFYTWFGSWLSRPPGAPGREIMEESATSEQVPWSKDHDVELAREVWSKFSPTAKSLFTTLMNEPGSKFSGDELAEMLGIANGKHGVAGVLAWPG